jgi:isochorismate pyruvate lyase
LAFCSLRSLIIANHFLPVNWALYVLSKVWSTMKYKNNIEPEDCSGMEDIRVEIDNMDRDIIAILGKRFDYVKAASKFKTSETSVRAPERFKAMLEQRRVWASSEGLNPDAIEKMYRDLVNHFIKEEMSKWQSESTNV